MTARRHHFDGRLRQSPDPRGWTFLPLPEPLSAALRDTHPLNGFGSLRVRATIGTSTWETSVFPDRRSSAYLLPVKAAVRRAENVDDGDAVAAAIEVIE